MASSSLVEIARRVRVEMEAVAEAVKTITAAVPTGNGGGAGTTIINNFGPTNPDGTPVAGAAGRTTGINHGIASIGPSGTGGNNGVLSIGSGGGGESGVLSLSLLEKALRFLNITGDRAKQARENEQLASQIVASFLAELTRRGALTPNLSDQLRIGGA